MGDEESKAGHNAENIHHKRSREQIDWSVEASQELLRLRFQHLRSLFDNAQTVVEVHEAWGVVASKLRSQGDWGLQLDAVKCSDQLTKLRHQWQESSTTQLHLMMDKCFSKKSSVFETQSPPVRNSLNRAMEESLVQDAKADIMPKRSKTIVPQQKQETLVSPSSDPNQAETLSSSEPAPTSSEPALPIAQDAEASTVSLHEDELSLASEPTAVSSQQPDSLTCHDAPLVTALDEEDDFHRQDEIMCALEKRSQQLKRLAQSHQHLANVTQQLLNAKHVENEH